MIFKFPKKIKKQKEVPKLGDFKVKKRFAFFPTRINDELVIWLGFYHSIYKYKQTFEMKYYGNGVGRIEVNKWIFVQRKIYNIKK